MGGTRQQTLHGEMSEGSAQWGRAEGVPRGRRSSDAPHGRMLRAEQEPRLTKPITVLRPIPPYVKKKKAETHVYYLSALSSIFK